MRVESKVFDIISDVDEFLRLVLKFEVGTSLVFGVRIDRIEELEWLLSLV